jgi:putative transcriptional regulator
VRLKLHRLFYIHTLGRIVSGSIEIAEGLYIGGDIEEILSYIRRGNTVEGHIKFFLGYSGWEAGQLEEEIANIYWIVSEKVSPLFCICGDGEQSWREAVVDLGEAYKSWLKYPRFPILN